MAAAVLCAPLLTLAGCAGGPGREASIRPAGPVAGARVPAYNRPYQVRGRWYAPHEQPGYDQVGVASWYSYEAPSRRTSDGERFDIGVASAAHTTLPIPSWLEVTNLDNGRRARIRLNDRGPFVSTRILDVSRAAAEELGFVQQGTAHVRVRYLGPAATLGGSPAVWASSAPPTGARQAPTPLAARYADAGDVPPPDPHAEVAEDSRLADDAPETPSAALEPVAYQRSLPSPRTPASVAQGSVGAFEVQAASFADRGNAERAAARLGVAGQASIRPLQRGDAVLYRVTVGPWSDAELAATARAEVARLGFPDARVVMR